MDPKTSIAIRAFEVVEHKKHQMEKAEQELSRAVEQVPSIDLSVYMMATERLQSQIALNCRNGCATGEREALLERKEK